MSYVPPIEREIKDFYRDHVDALYRSCCFLSGGQGDAEAMVRTVFHNLLAGGLEFTSDRDARAWMIMEACRLAKHPNKLRSPAEENPQPPEPAAEVQPTENIQEPESAEDLPLQSEQEQTEEKSAEQEDPAPELQTEETPAAETQDPEESAPDQEVILPQEEACNVQEEFDHAPLQEEETPQPEPEKEPEEAPQKADVFGEIRKLSYKNRLVALLYYCEGYRKAEIANYLGCPEFRVKARLRQVAKVIQDDMGGEEEC